MSKTVLGISAFYHDSAAALVVDGEIVAAAQEERFSRKKHDPRFPVGAINYCLEEAFIEAAELDAIVFYDNPLLTWDRVLKNCLMMGETAFPQFSQACRSVLGIKVWVREYVRHALGSLGKDGKLLFSEHHQAHAASAFYPSTFKEAAILTLDGVGEWETTTLGFGQGNRIELHQVLHYPHSLGLLYSAFTYFCGFKVNSGEYKLMGLAPYGKPQYYRTIRDHLIDVKEDGSFRLNPEYFGFLDSNFMTNEKFERLFGGPPRAREGLITRRERDLAASVQQVLEEVVVKLACHLKQETGARNLAMAGGVALNCVANGRILREGIFDRLWIQPAAGDAGGALGAALLGCHVYFGSPRRFNPAGRDLQKGSHLGPAYSPAEVRAFLDRHGYPYEHLPEATDRRRRVAQAIAAGKIVGYFCGRMEFGPRALGSRSILGDPRDPGMQSRMNLKIKYRESFRPFAPSVLLEEAAAYFDLPVESPYMLLVAPVREARRLPFNREEMEKIEDLRVALNQPRSDIPAVTHVDYSARVQTVHPQDNPDYYALLQEFKNLAGCAVLINTSFNIRGEPIVCSPQDAYRCFRRTQMDLLVLEDCLLWKEQQPPWEDQEDWQQEYDLD
jgi:carbamoyltransferase